MNEKTWKIGETGKGPLEIHDDFNLLAAIWMLSATDEMHIVTYCGLAARLSKPEPRLRELVAGRLDLFRLRVPVEPLEAWKGRLRGLTADKQLPAWLRSVPEEGRGAAIEALRPEDCFRNIFRVKEESPPLDRAGVEFGLAQIERLRKGLIDHAMLGANLDQIVANIQKLSSDRDIAKQSLDKIEADTKVARETLGKLERERYFAAVTLVAAVIAAIASLMTAILKANGKG